MAVKKKKVDPKTLCPKSVYMLYLKSDPKDRSEWIFGSNPKDCREGNGPGVDQSHYGVIRYIRADIVTPGGNS